MTLNDNSSREDYPPLSVIVYSQAWCKQLKSLIQTIMSQEYPGKFEIIVVNEDKDQRTEDEVSELMGYYDNLYLTFSPGHSKNLSRRKLSLMLGIKAAQYDCLVFTASNCMISSSLWLKAIGRHFIAGNDVVLGYADIRSEDSDVLLTKMQSYDLCRESVRWLSAALVGSPVRGTAFNLAYKKDLFYRYKGFSEHLHLLYGDDDLFVRRITEDAPCAVELSSSSIVTVVEPDLRKAYRLAGMFRAFTSKLLPRASYRIMASLTWASWIWLLSSVLAAVFGWGALWPPIAVGVIFFALWTSVMASYHRVMRTLKLRPLFWTVPFLFMIHPFYSLSMRLKRRGKRESNFAWGVYRPF